MSGLTGACPSLTVLLRRRAVTFYIVLGPNETSRSSLLRRSSHFGYEGRNYGVFGEGE